MNIQDQLRQGGYQESDIRLAALLTRRAVQNHYSLDWGIKGCTACPLSCNGTPVRGTGPWNSPLMIIADQPGEEEDRFGMPLIGPEGQLLTMVLSKAGIDRNAIYMTSAVKCRSLDTPLTVEHMQKCSTHIINEIEAVAPKVILTFGDVAMKTVRGDYDLTMNNESQRIHQVSFKTMTSIKEVSVIHTYGLDLLLRLEGDRLKNLKSTLYNAVVLAANATRMAKPDYQYDRVGLNELVAEVNQP